MVETLFVALFVVLPLAAALLFLLFRARIFLRNVAVVVLLAVGVWGALKFAASDFALFERTSAQPAHYQPASCFAPDPAGRAGRPEIGCAL